MGLIIDANKRDAFFSVPLGDAESAILRWLQKAGKIIIGGRLRRELVSSQKMRGYLTQLKRAGRLHDVLDSDVDGIEASVSASGNLRSDDPHVIALALVSGGRLLHTSDADLISDFKDKRIVDAPRGRIFNGNARMLRECVQ